MLWTGLGRLAVFLLNRSISISISRVTGGHEVVTGGGGPVLALQGAAQEQPVLPPDGVPLLGQQPTHLHIGEGGGEPGRDCEEGGFVWLNAGKMLNS